MRSAALCASLVIVGCPIAAHAQSASTVIERHINAIGGKKAIEQIVSTEVSGTVTSGDGRSGVFAQRTRRPQLFSVSLTWGEARWRTGFNGRSSWQDDSDGWRTLYGAAAARVRAEAFHANTHLLADKVNQLLVTGQDRVRDRPVIVVVAIASDGTRRTLFFDAQSYLLVKDEQQTEAGMEARFFDDYRRVDQVMEPHRIEWQRNGETFRIAVERITHNAPVDEHLFDVPAAPTEPAVNIDAVLSAAERNEQTIARQLASYTYTSTSTSGRVDEKGRVTQLEGESYEVFFLGDQSVRRLIKKRGGQPLTEAERRAEDERVNRIVREYEAQRASGKPGRPVPAVVSDVSGTAVRTPVLGVGGLAAYRRICDFSNVRRERVGGRAAVVVEFQPKRGVAPNGDIERQATKVAGTVWIDEATQYVIRVDAYFRDDYDRTAQGSSMWNERIRVNDEVWVPSRDDKNVRWSFAFGNRAQFLGGIKYTDYKKFSVDTDATITLPDAGR